jgi:hypothetical protein
MKEHLKEMREETIVWNAPCSLDGERTMKQHAFKDREFMSFHGEYFGAQSLCEKITITEDEEIWLSVDKISPQILNESRACKICLSKYKKLGNKLPDPLQWLQDKYDVPDRDLDEIHWTHNEVAELIEDFVNHLKTLK